MLFVLTLCNCMLTPQSFKSYLTLEIRINSLNLQMCIVYAKRQSYILGRIGGI